MLEVVTYITIQQQGTDRKKTLFFDFVNEFEATDSWEDFTNQAKITLPKKIYYVDDNNQVQSIDNIGGVTGGATFMRGDTVEIRAGYRYYKSGELLEDINPIFNGYISKVGSKMPFDLECEDNFYKLKQLPAKGGNNGFFSGKKYTVEQMITEMLSDTNFTVSQKTQTNIGDFILDYDMTVAQALEKLRKDYHLESFFRGNELIVGYLVYDEELAKEHEAKQKKVFVFQHNIIEDDLSYQNRKDVILSAIGYSVNSFKISTGKKTKDGKDKTKDERLQVLVYTDKDGNLVGVKKEKGKDFPENKEGERRTFYFNDIKSSDDLIQKVKDKLQLYYYTGFKGSFTTFGTPFCEQGDNCYIIDQILPERNGYYKIKSVKYKGGTGGLRQEIEIAYRIGGISENDLKTLLK